MPGSFLRPVNLDPLKSGSQAFDIFIKLSKGTARVENQRAKPIKIKVS